MYKDEFHLMIFRLMIFRLSKRLSGWDTVFINKLTSLYHIPTYSAEEIWVPGEKVDHFFRVPGKNWNTSSGFQGNGTLLQGSREKVEHFFWVPG